MHFETVAVTPDQARAWLEASSEITQRALVKRRVERFAHDMRHGHWRETHQAIAIDELGRVIDGQHRLSAVVLSERTVTMTVAREADASTFVVLDTGAARFPSDALRIAGLTNSTIKASIARLLLAYDLVKGTTTHLQNAAKTVTTTDVVAVFDDHERGELIAAGERYGARLAREIGRLGLRTWAAAVYVIAAESKLGESTRAEFFERLVDGQLLDVGSPILALRNWLTRNTGLNANPNNDRSAQCIANMIKALNDYAKGHERTVVYFRLGRELMPVVELPDEALFEAELAAEQRERAASSRRNAARRSKVAHK